MKYALTTTLLIFLFVSCDTTDKQAPEQTNELIEQFKPFLHGVWVPSEYIDAIVKTKSPLRSSEKIPYVSEFIIDTTRISGDSIDVFMALGNHEGSDFTLRFKQGQTDASLPTNISDFENKGGFYELGYINESNESYLVLYRYDKNKKLLGKTKYSKVEGVKPDHNLENGFQYIVNQNLVAGSYKGADSGGKEMTVTLSDNGKVNGLQNFTTYHILTDFVAAPENVADLVNFYSDKEDKWYEFEIRKDTLYLFKAPEDENDTTFQRGSPLYQLIRQNK